MRLLPRYHGVGLRVDPHRRRTAGGMIVGNEDSGKGSMSQARSRQQDDIEGIELMQFTSQARSRRHRLDTDDQDPPCRHVAGRVISEKTNI